MEFNLAIDYRNVERKQSIFSVLSKIDPSHTLPIKKRFIDEVEKRFNWLIELIEKGIGEQDLLGLNNEGLTVSEIISVDKALGKLAENKYTFKTSAQKIDGFMEWLDDMENAGILETKLMPGVGRIGAKVPWTDTYIQSAYQQGIYDSRQAMKSRGVDITLRDPDPTKDMFVSFNQPFHSERCFISPLTPIYTLKGWKKIKDVKVGDKVLTHKGRFKKVTKLIRTPKQLPRTVKIQIKDSSHNKGKSITVTHGHPVYVNGKWISAERTKPGDKVRYLASECETCGTLIPFSKRFCSNKCVQENKFVRDRKSEAMKKQWKRMGRYLRKRFKESFENGTRDRFEATKKANKKIREIYASGVPFGWRGMSEEEMEELQRKAKEGRERVGWEGFKNKKLREKATKLARISNRRRIKEGSHPFQNKKVRKKALKNYLRWIRRAKKENIKIGLQDKKTLKKALKASFKVRSKDGFISKPEQRMGEILDDLGIYYINSYGVNTGKHYYFVDYALPDYKLFIEVDGIYWHEGKERKDKKRERRIIRVRPGWDFLRFTDKEVLDFPEEVSGEVDRLISNHKKKYKFIEMEVESVKKRRVKTSRMLFNFSVEDDESYIANGFAVHNCGVLYTRTFNDLKGITKAMDTQISRVLAEGISEGKNSREVARMLVDRVNKIGITRAKTLARTEIQRAHHHANINEYEAAGLNGVVVKAEWETGVNPCEICAVLQGEVFTLQEIRGMIPVHPNCACIALPYQPGIDKVKPAIPSVSGWLPDCEVVHDILPFGLEKDFEFVTLMAKKCLTGTDKARVKRAIKSHIPATRLVQRQAIKNQGRLARNIRGAREVGDNDPFDVMVGSTKNPKHLIEVKTIVRGKNNKITMHPDALGRKKAFAAKYPDAKVHTVVFDDRVGKVYYNEGVGSFRLKGMTEVSDVKGVGKVFLMK